MDKIPVLWPKVQSFIKRECGVVLSDDQHYLMDARLGPVAREFRSPSLDAFIEGACSAPPSTPQARAVIDAMTTHESLFFRDQQFWKILEEQIMPALLAGAAGRPLRFWSAACSHGQEPYSLAMLLEEKWPEVARTAEIIGSDVSLAAVERAKEGIFTPLEVNRGLGAARLVRHFQQEPGGMRVKKPLRARITFTAHNLLGPQPTPKNCDVVLCRNVLIYFSDSDRRMTLAAMEAATRAGGFIALGGTETTPRPQLAAGWYRVQSR